MKALFNIGQTTVVAVLGDEETGSYSGYFTAVIPEDLEGKVTPGWTCSEGVWRDPESSIPETQRIALGLSKSELLSQLNALKDAKLLAGFEFLLGKDNSYTLPTQETDLAYYSRLLQLALALEEGEDDSIFTLPTVSGEKVTLSIEAFVTCIKALFTQQQLILLAYWKHLTDLEPVTAEDALALYDIQAGWPV